MLLNIHFDAVVTLLAGVSCDMLAALAVVLKNVYTIGIYSIKCTGKIWPSFILDTFHSYIADSHWSHSICSNTNNRISA